MRQLDHPQTVATGPSVLLFSMDGDGRLLTHSTGWARFLGVEGEQAADVIRRHWTDFLHPEDRHAFRRSLRSVGHDLTLITRVRLKRQDGEYRTMQVRAFAHPSPEGGQVFAGLMSDETDPAARDHVPPGSSTPRELAEAAVRAFSKARRRASTEQDHDRRSVDALLSASPDAMALIDRDGRYLHANDELARLVGMPRHELTGRDVRDSCPMLWRSIVDYVESDAGNSEPAEVEVALPSDGEHPLDMLVRVYPVSGQDGRLLGLGVSLTDISTHKQSERALQQSNALKDEFLSIASHELRNPVAAVRGSAQLLVRNLRRGRLSEERLETHLAAILNASEHLAMLTDDLLDVSRLQRGQFPVRPRRVSLVAITRRFIARHATRDRCRVSVEDDRSMAYVDPDRYEQILENLLENADKYAPDGSPIEVSLRSRDGGVLLTVRDHGMGLPPRAAEQIFRLFGRAPNAIANNVPGLGLGLYICRRIAEQNGGRLWAESDGEGTGTSMFAWFPREGPESGSAT